MSIKKILLIFTDLKVIVCLIIGIFALKYAINSEERMLGIFGLIIAAVYFFLDYRALKKNEETQAKTETSMPPKEKIVKMPQKTTKKDQTRYYLAFSSLWGLFP